MIDIGKIQHIHFSGIKGVGMTSLALCAKDLGIKVTGSDTDETFVTDDILTEKGIEWNVGFSPQNLDPRPDLVIFTGAHADNPEIVFAKKHNIPTMTLSEAQGMFAASKEVTIAVGGVGGKSTISSMIAHIFSINKLHPSFAIGVGNIFSLGTPGRYDKKGKYFILEADEFAVLPGKDLRPRFSYLWPKILVLTNIEHDHPDVYPTLEDTKKVFKDFVARVPEEGLVVSLKDNAVNQEVLEASSAPVLTYGKSLGADFRVEKVFFKNGRSIATIATKEGSFALTLPIPGRFNVLNALAALIVAEREGVRRESILSSLARFKGVKRRLEKVGEKDGIQLWDDYAHHPKEIQMAIQAMREWLGRRRLIAVFQPHTYSRTKVLLSQFASAFAGADAVLIMDIYPSARETTSNFGFEADILAEEIAKRQRNVWYTKGKKETVKFLTKYVQPKDVVLTMGAGDIFHIHQPFLEAI